MNKKEDIPKVFYFYLHSKLMENAKEDKMEMGELRWRLFQWKIPKELRTLIIAELIHLKLIDKLSQHEVRFNKSIFDINNLQRYYIELGII